MSTKYLKTTSLVMLLLVLSLWQAGAATLVAQWDFEGPASTTALENKVQGIDWSIYFPTDKPAGTISNGKLSLQAEYVAATDSWDTQKAHADLVTDIQNFYERTTVLWLSLDKLGDADDYAFMFRLYGYTDPAKSDLCNWYASHSQFDYRAQNEWGYATWVAPFGTDGYGPALTPGKVMKLAYVLKDNTDGTFDLTYYLDKLDGNGLQQYGQTMNFYADYVSAFGTPSDEVQFLPGCSNLTGDTFGVTFEECRIYDGVMSMSEIDDLTYNGQPKLVGQWTFDDRGSTDALGNKASGINWSPLALTQGAAISDGQLKLSRYLSGTYQQGNATTMLKTDLGAEGYFKEMTQVAWVKFADFDWNSWTKIMGICKFSSSAFELWNKKAASTLLWKTGAGEGWQSNVDYEYLDGSNVLTTGGLWPKFGSEITPPSDKFVKMVRVVRAKGDGNYEAVMYWDIQDGNGLVQIGTPQHIWAIHANLFGQFGTDCLVDPAGGPRYDGFGFMDYSWITPQSAGGEVDFDEVRIYAGAMDPVQIDELTAVDETPRMIGQWTFDDRGATDALGNKVSDVQWEPITLSGTGTTVTNGALKIVKQGTALGKATTKLLTDLGPSKYFREQTHVLWLTLTDTSVGYSVQLDSLFKTIGGPTATQRTYQTTWWRNTAAFYPKNSYLLKWQGTYYDQPTGTLKTGGGGGNEVGQTLTNLPANQMIKFVHRVKRQDATKYYAEMFVDTGSGLSKIGTTPITMWNNQINGFGQSGTPSLVDPVLDPNPQYDYFQLMVWAQSLSATCGDFYVEEARVYDGPLSEAEMDTLEYVPVQPSTTEQKLVGQWTFDNYLGTGPLENKASGVVWNQMTVTGIDAGVVNGKLKLPRYNDGAWIQSSATTMLQSDLGSNGYFREQTHVAWIYWPGFDPSAFVGITNLAKFESPNFVAWQTKAREQMIWNSASGWMSNGMWEIADGTNSQQWFYYNSTLNPPTDSLVKIAWVIKRYDHTRYDAYMYWDKGDGNGLVLLGGPTIIWQGWVNAFGQCGTPSIPYPNGGARFDGFGLMDYSWSVPALAGDIYFEEARIYGYALTSAEIDSLKYVGQSGVVKPVVGTSNKNVLDSIMTTAASEYDWVLWGTVTVVNDDEFTIDDGSGVPIKVILGGHGFAGGEHVSVKGSIDVGATPPTLTATEVAVY